MSYVETLMQRATETANALRTGTPLPTCPYPAGMQADCYTAGAAAVQLETLVNELRLALAELEAAREVSA